MSFSVVDGNCENVIVVVVEEEGSNDIVVVCAGDVWGYCC